MHVHACVPAPQFKSEEVRGQLGRVVFFLAPCESWVSNSNYRALQQVSLPVEPSHQPCGFVLDLGSWNLGTAWLAHHTCPPLLSCLYLIGQKRMYTDMWAYFDLGSGKFLFPWLWVSWIKAGKVSDWEVSSSLDVSVVEKHLLVQARKALSAG